MAERPRNSWSQSLNYFRPEETEYAAIAKDKELAAEKARVVSNSQRASFWGKISAYATWASIGLLATTVPTTLQLISGALEPLAITAGFALGPGELVLTMFALTAVASVAAVATNQIANRIAMSNHFDLAEIEASRTAKHIALELKKDKVVEVTTPQEKAASWSERIAAEKVVMEDQGPVRH